MIWLEDWKSLKIGDKVYALKDLYSYCDEFGHSKYADKGDLLIIRGFSDYSPNNPWVSHENITDGSGFYIRRNEVSLMQHFSFN